MTTSVATTMETEYIDKGGGGDDRSEETMNDSKRNEKSYSEKLKTNVRIILLFCLCYGKNHHEKNISSSDIIKQLQMHKLMV